MNVHDLVVRSDGISIAWQDGHHSEYHAIWLLDNDPANRDPRTGQRLVDVAGACLDGSIASAEAVEGALCLCWSDGRSAAFPLDWLSAHCPCGEHAQPKRVRRWNGSDGETLRRFPYQQVRTSGAIQLEWLETIASAGLAFLSDVPAGESRALEVAALLGWIRETNYGRVFDVRAVPNPNNLAYTGLALGLHTDNPYREPVPGLQILHCRRAGSQGGASLFADGFSVAEAFRSAEPDAFAILASTPVRFEFADASTYLSAERPIIQCDRQGRVEAIHYNNRSIAPLRIPCNQIPEFYHAYQALARVLQDPQHILTTLLAEGEVVAFDNRRVLHGRTGFASAEPRHLEGCYLDQDGLHSRIAVLKRNERH